MCGSSSCGQYNRERFRASALQAVVSECATSQYVDRLDAGDHRAESRHTDTSIRRNHGQPTRNRRIRGIPRSVAQDRDGCEHRDPPGPAARRAHGQARFAEFWIGEHHSGGVEIVSSPEMFLAAAAQRTSRIKLGLGGVVSLPYHHPFMIADRLVLLDHLSRGRVIFGAGPGQLADDAT